MKHYLLIAVLAAGAVAQLAAQSPKGWMVRADRSTSATDPDGAGNIKFVTMANGFHATNPQAAVFWNPANTGTGAYTVKGTFKLLKPSGHTNYYGLVFGGSDLGGAAQSYLYFLVAQPWQYADNPAWWAKVAFLLIAGVNAAIFERVLTPRLRALGPGEDTPASFKIAGAASLVCWFGVLYCGRMLAFVVPN